MSGGNPVVPWVEVTTTGWKVLREEQITEAHAYAYRGAVIQDLGLYPFGSREFSDLVLTDLDQLKAAVPVQIVAGSPAQ